MNEEDNTIPAFFDKAADNAIPDTYAQEQSCLRCGGPFDFVWGEDVFASDGGAAGLCPVCARSYPASLLKAACDPFDYALRLTTGEVIYFETCGFHGEWVHLTVHRCPYQHSHDMTSIVHPFERGLDIRLTAIVWCADAPEGS